MPSSVHVDLRRASDEEVQRGALALHSFGRFVQLPHHQLEALADDDDWPVV